MTVDPGGYPHIALLSSGQIRLGGEPDELLAVVRGTTTRANLAERGLATLLVVGADAAHYLKLAVARSVSAYSRLGVALRLDEVVRDSVGVPLSPLQFQRSVALAEREGWGDDTAVLDLLSQHRSTLS